MIRRTATFLYCFLYRGVIGERRNQLNHLITQTKKLYPHFTGNIICHSANNTPP